MTTNEEFQKRWDDVRLLQKHYARFDTFLYDVIHGLMGFDCTWVQLDIADYLEHGPLYRMIQAQRGQAKTTITAAYAVWRLIHNPAARILIVSSGGPMATQIANWVIQIIMKMPELECLRPDRSAGDRTSVTSFDLHYALKGPEKSPSVACLGIKANMQGYRADILIADDVESKKNSQTATQRDLLVDLTRDFTSICSTGDIIYLGTPQSTDSIYNSLPGRGFDIRIWTGRYPTSEELPNYNGFLAPSIMERIKLDPANQSGGGPLGDRGQPIDPVLLGEAVLSKKEIDQGKAYFQLQHMLDTALMDKDRYPLKPENVLYFAPPRDRTPIVLNWSRSEINKITKPQNYPIQFHAFRAQQGSQEYGAFQGCHMYVDPSGGGKNGDEMAYAVTKFIAGYVYLVDCDGMPGGIEDPQFEFVTAAAVKWKPQMIHVEENFGKGAFRKVWQSHLLKQHKCGIEDVWETGQKELRIIDTLEPVIGSGRLVIDEDLIARDWQSAQKYPAQNRGGYTLMFQMARITRERGALVHDDRLDAVAGSVRFWIEHLARDKEKDRARAANEAYRQMVKDPLGTGRPVPGMKTVLGVRRSAMNALDKYRRK
jgi:hypothetical protein